VITYIPETPGGTLLLHLESETEDEAWDKLLVEASHMPYGNKQGFIDRGYEVLKVNDER